ncbi:DUF6240 domain-containing protein [Butyrivibrio sp. VCB2006]|uniref:DUF6240 domain-containing protein n=1 Tax=Butyrivibrio sp. VCB2006 TaxID=1280679 RepID=UPI000424E38F|nr:DUF6240 domain-containing protein [Butyrivibrio sp. VCB2006]
MNITFQAITGQRKDESLDTLKMDPKETFSFKTGKSSSSITDPVSIQLDASIFSNDAYSCQAKSAADVSDMANNTDVLTQHNYMALLSNTMSGEDYAKALEEGFDIKNTDTAETVTILDKIKSVLLESGQEIVGFNDDISLDKLARITGSMSFANELQQSFHENDIPVTYENSKAAGVAFSEVSDIQGLDDAAVKYLVLNNMRPSIENVYFASHSTNGQNVSGRGFYAQDAGGYYAQKAESYDWEQLDGQIDKIIEEAGLDKEDSNVREEARWTIQQGIPLTTETLKRVHTIKEISFPITEKLGAKAIAAAIADGRKAAQADLSDPRSIYVKALDIKNDTHLLESRMQLEEVRLRMTTEANRQLLDSGFSIDTAPMEQFIERIKNILGQVSDEVAGSAVDEITEVTPQNQALLISATINRVSIIQNGPIDVTGAMIDTIETASLTQISAVSKDLTLQYEKAAKGYEPLMTAPRADLGDNIKKAFQNVDEILKDLGQELTEENRRAVRVLGYNSMEMNQENFEKVRAFDQMLKTTLERLKPGAVLDIIREGKNPLSMTIDEISQNLDKNFMGDGDSSGKGRSKSDEKYSKFLYKLEHQKGITEDEKESFIGIYRLFHTLKAEDYRAIGSVLKTGAEMTLKNLLMATRTGHTSKKGIDYVVDDDFGGVEAASSSSSKLKIDEQISLAFRYHSAKADIVYENLEPEKLLKAKPTENTLLPKLAEDLQNAGVDENLEREYASEVVRQIREVAQVKVGDNAFEELKSLQLEANFNNLEAMISNRRDRKTGSIWRRTEELLKEMATKEQDMLVDALGEPKYEDIYQKSLQNISDSLEELLMDEKDTYIDVKAINLMQRRLSVMSQGSERGSFEVPVYLDGQKISMHITLKNDESMDSRMEASVQTYEYGLITASLSEKNGVVSGMITTNYDQNTEEVEYLESVRSKMCVKLAEKLKESGVSQENIAILYHAQTQPISVGPANANATDGNQKKLTDTSTLLSMAKAFIEAL